MTEINERILLTGAGFTANFGGLLAHEMWSHLLSDRSIRGMKEIKDYLRNQTNYEYSYAHIMGPDAEEHFTPEYKDALNKAMSNAYGRIEATLIQGDFAQSGSNGISFTDIYRLISLFRNNGEKKGFFFTLNQDMFVERYYWDQPKLTVAGLPQEHYEHWFNQGTDCRNRPYDKIEKLPVPVDSKLSTDQCGAFSYIKLHGSVDWITGTEKSVMVIGGPDKTSQIRGHSLLTSYWNIFKDVLHQPNRKLLIIGYGFADQHVNDVLRECVTMKGLELHVVNTMHHDELKNYLKNNSWSEIWEGINGYYPYTLKQLFQPSIWNYFKTSFFDN